jgi:hypothetical protein
VTVGTGLDTDVPSESFRICWRENGEVDEITAPDVGWRLRKEVTGNAIKKFKPDPEIEIS